MFVAASQYWLSHHSHKCREVALSVATRLVANLYPAHHSLDLDIVWEDRLFLLRIPSSAQFYAHLYILPALTGGHKSGMFSVHMCLFWMFADIVASGFS